MTSRTKSITTISIHALLAESDPPYNLMIHQPKNFYPRSPCGERQARRASRQQPAGISIHALLAESDTSTKKKINPASHFYPRSPCGERRYWPCVFVVGRAISIHALLAESDHQPKKKSTRQVISIHALLAESDRRKQPGSSLDIHFYPRSPCGERLINNVIDGINEIFLSTLSLRRATSIKPILSKIDTNFYPRSPCGERLLGNAGAE